MKSSPFIFARPVSALALFTLGFCFLGAVFTRISADAPTPEMRRAQAERQLTPPGAIGDHAPYVEAFRQSVGGDVTPVMVELKEEPGALKKVAAEREGRVMSVEAIGAHAVSLAKQQNSFLQSLAGRGVRAIMRSEDVQQVDG